MRRFKRSHRRNVHMLSTVLHITVHSTEQRASGACILGHLLIFSFPVWDELLSVRKILSFYLSRNVMSITPSFVVLDLCPIILFQKIVKHHVYIHLGLSTLTRGIRTYYSSASERHTSITDAGRVTSTASRCSDNEISFAHLHECTDWSVKLFSY